MPVVGWLLNCVVSGQKVGVSATPETRVGSLMMLALEAAGHSMEEANLWEARDADGELLVRSNSLRHSDLEDGDQIFIDPKPGVGA